MNESSITLMTFSSKMVVPWRVFRRQHGLSGRPFEGVTMGKDPPTIIGARGRTTGIKGLWIVESIGAYI